MKEYKRLTDKKIDLDKLSEKVKEIKKGLEVCTGICNETCPYYTKHCMTDLSKDALTLINELESENERLSKELDSEWKDRRKAEEDLHKAQWNYKIGLGQSQSVNKKLKDRIAELEAYIKCNEQGAKAFVNGWNKDLKTELKKFAERLKEMAYKSTDWSHGEHPLVVEVDYIDEVLEEFIE